TAAFEYMYKQNTFGIQDKSDEAGEKLSEWGKAAGDILKNPGESIASGVSAVNPFACYTIMNTKRVGDCSMKSEVQHLANNERYRILMIDGEAYIMDIESSFWKIIFPFLFWLLPNHVFKVEDQTVIELLKTERMKKAGASYLTFVTGISYAGGMLLA